jgi:hypothetical protein
VGAFFGIGAQPNFSKSCPCIHLHPFFHVCLESSNMTTGVHPLVDVNCPPAATEYARSSKTKERWWSCSLNVRSSSSGCLRITQTPTTDDNGGGSGRLPLEVPRAVRRPGAGVLCLANFGRERCSIGHTEHRSCRCTVVPFCEHKSSHYSAIGTPLLST